MMETFLSVIVVLCLIYVSVRKSKNNTKKDKKNENQDIYPLW